MDPEPLYLKIQRDAMWRKRGALARSWARIAQPMRRRGAR